MKVCDWIVYLYGLGRSGIGTKRALEEEAKKQEAKRQNVDPEEYRELMAQRAKEAQRMRRSRAAASLVEKLDKDKVWKTLHSRVILCILTRVILLGNRGTSLYNRCLLGLTIFL